MDSERDTTALLQHALVPVAHAEDARQTAGTLAPYAPEHVIVLHVVEKGEGVPEKTPVVQSEEIAADAFAAVRTVFPHADEYTAYGRDVVGAMFQAADEVDASAIAYRSRGGGRIKQFLSGDLTLKLATKADRPAIALPRTSSNE